MGRSIYLIVRVDIETPDDYDYSDMEIAEDFRLDGVSLDAAHECSVTDYEICGVNV